MDLTRRDILKASTVVAAGLGLQSAGVLKLERAFGLESTAGGLSVIWIQGQSCSGCSVSLLNSIYYDTIDHLLTSTLDLNYHPTIMAAAGRTAQAAAQAAYARGNYVLVVEGAIPTGANGNYCTIWDGMTAQTAVRRYASRASYIVAAGACASFGGMAGGSPNPTGAKSVKAILAQQTGGRHSDDHESDEDHASTPPAFSAPLVNLPGCPVHPDWIVGTIAYILANGKAPSLDANGRPTDFYAETVHSHCPLLGSVEATTLGEGFHCLRGLGCHGPTTYADCPSRKWNSPAAGTPGVSWCVLAGSPCIGCTEPTFPDGMSPFYFGPRVGGA